LNVHLTDFGGSTCGDIDGGHLPDAGFFNPRSAWVSTVTTDIFSLGSVFYTIMTGHWPYKSPGPFESVEEKDNYEETVDALFLEGKFPPVDDMVGGTIIQGCWTDQYKDAETLLHDQELLVEEVYIQKYLKCCMKLSGCLVMVATILLIPCCFQAWPCLLLYCT
jgi:hypothetical protein